MKSKFDDESVRTFWNSQDAFEREILKDEIDDENDRLQNELERFKEFWKEQIDEICRQFSFCAFPKDGNVFIFFDSIANYQGEDMVKIKTQIEDAKVLSE